MLEEVEIRSLVEDLAPDLAQSKPEPQPAGFDKWVWFLGEDHMLRVARHDIGRQRMVRERLVLRRLGGRLGEIEVPAVVTESADGTADICRRVAGRALHWREWDHVSREVKAGLAFPMGEAMAALHDAVPTDQLRGLGLPPPRVLNTEALRGLVGRTGHERRERLLATVLAVASKQVDTQVVLLHNDLGLHNLSLDPDTLGLRGIFDFGDVAVGDPHVDTRYDPVFEAGGSGMLGAYRSVRGVTLVPERQALLHAMAALENLDHSLTHEGPELQARRFGWVDEVAAWAPSRYGG